MGDSLARCLWVAAILAGRRLSRDRAAPDVRALHWRLVHELSSQLGHPPYPRG